MASVHISDEQLAAFQHWYTPLVSDAMDRLGIANHVMHRAIQSMRGGMAEKICGVAFPCRVVPANEYVDIDILLAMVDAIPRGAMVIVAADADIDAALWGGLMSTRAAARGAVGAVVNGGVRDLEQLAEIHFPVFGTYRCVKDIRTRGFMHSFDVPVECGGVRVAPGDVVFGDANGVVVIPQENFSEVYAELQNASSEEHATMKGLRDGEDAVELYKKYKRF